MQCAECVDIKGLIVKVRKEVVAPRAAEMMKARAFRIGALDAETAFLTRVANQASLRTRGPLDQRHVNLVLAGGEETFVDALRA